MRQRRSLATRSAVALTILVMASCGDSGNSGANEGPAEVAYVLFDVSGSSEAPEIRDGYRDDFQSILEELDLERGVVVSVDIIDDNPLAHSSPVSEEFAPFSSLSDNRLQYDREATQKRQALADGLDQLLERSSRGTDIFGALSNAESFFGSYSAAETKKLVVFSDMVQSTDKYKFSRMRWNQRKVERTIRDQEAHLPNLEGVSACVVGAGTVASDRLSADSIRGIESFWIEYFRRTGADLPPERYGAALIRCA